MFANPVTYTVMHIEFLNYCTEAPIAHMLKSIFKYCQVFSNVYLNVLKYVKVVTFDSHAYIYTNTHITQ